MEPHPPMQTDHILCALPGPERTELTARLRTTFPASKDVNILFTFVGLPRDRTDAPKLEWLQLLSAGSDHVRSNWMYEDPDVKITTTSGIHGPPIAEWAIMTALTHSRRYNHLWEMKQARKWDRNFHDWSAGVADRVGLRVGILGYGSIGRQIGRVANALGMEVLAYTATEKSTPDQRKYHGFIVPGTGDPEGTYPVKWASGLDKPSLHRFLEQNLDWVVVTLPLTNETKNLLSVEEFQILGRNGRRPFITNVARGPIIDHTALKVALEANTISGAALDVTEPEPLPEHSELWKMDNVIITPHISSNSSSYTDRAFQVLEENLRRRATHRSLLNVAGAS